MDDGYLSHSLPRIVTRQRNKVYLNLGLVLNISDFNNLPCGHCHFCLTKLMHLGAMNYYSGANLKPQHQFPYNDIIPQLA